MEVPTGVAPFFTPDACIIVTGASDDGRGDCDDFFSLIVAD